MTFLAFFSSTSFHHSTTHSIGESSFYFIEELWPGLSFWVEVRLPGKKCCSLSLMLLHHISLPLRRDRGWRQKFNLIPKKIMGRLCVLPPNGYRSRCGRPIYVSPSVRLLIRRGIEGRTPYLLPNAVAWQNRRWGNVCVTCDSIPLSLCWDSGWNRKLQSIGINRVEAGRRCALTG